jgi:hypothetical protein
MGDPAPSEDGSPPESRPALRALDAWLLLLVCLCFFVLQSIIVPRRSPPGWDESIYLSQVTRGAEAVFFASWRARGITLLVAPAAGASIEVLRVYLMVLSTVGLGLSLSVWMPFIRFAAPVAALLFSSTWVALQGASQVMPNFWSAVFCVAAAGFTLRSSEGGKTRHSVFAAAALAAAGLIRPPDATVLFVVLAAYVALSTARSWRVVLSLACGLFLGWLPWVIEMSVRFGGLLEAVREAAAGFDEPPPLFQKLLHYLSYAHGRGSELVVMPGVIWWSLLALLSVLGFMRAISRGERAATLLASLAALAMMLQYLFFVPNPAARFLLPAYALLAIPASIGLVSLLRGRWAARSVGAILLLLVLPWTALQADVAGRVANNKREVNGMFRGIGREIKRLADGASCSFLSRRNFPQIQLASGCAGDRLGPGPLKEEELDRLTSSADLAFVIVRKPMRRNSLRRILPDRFHVGGQVWFIYQLPGTSGTAADDGVING